MIIRRNKIGSNSRRTVYCICNSVNDTGENKPDEIVMFDSLELATLVMRYIRGDNMNEADQYRAKEALINTDGL